MIWPEVGNKMIWPDVGKILIVARRGEFNGCGKKRVIQTMWQEERNIDSLARSG